jgi:hypothetical protein
MNCKKMTESISRITLRSLCVLIVVNTNLQPCSAQTNDIHWHVVICGGILQDAQAKQAEARVIGGLSQFFTDQLGIGREAVNIVCDKQSPAFGPNAIACTRESLKKTLADIASAAGHIDRFVFYYTGQANRAANTLRLNLRGQDIVHEELVQWLGTVKARQKLIILDCPCAGLALKDLADPNTIIVCSARSDQYDSPRFSDYFVPALLQWEPDKDVDGRLSLLEAFQTTTRELDKYYEQEKCYKSENALLEDDGDGVPSQQPWLFTESGKDGARAAQFFFRQTQTTASLRGQ